MCTNVMKYLHRLYMQIIVWYFYVLPRNATTMYNIV